MSVSVPGYPNLRYIGGAAAKPAEQHIAADTLGRLQQAAVKLGVRFIDIFSGSGGPAVRGGGFAGDPHDRAIAADASINGTPVGSYPGAVAVLHSVGLRTGATDFSYQGKPDPAHVDTVGMSAAQAPSTGMISIAEGIGRIIAGGVRRALDPFALIAVSQSEGLSGKIGDNGHAFGPFQLNDAGGQFPSTLKGQSTAGWSQPQKNAWAWSQEGIDYALDRAAVVARGQRGTTAITSLVTRFEKPRNPGNEVAAATQNYTALIASTGGNPDQISTKLVGSNPSLGGLIDGIPGVSSVEAVAGFLGKLTDPSYLLRGMQILAGAVLVLTGIVLLTRQVALAADVPLPPGGAAVAGALA